MRQRPLPTLVAIWIAVWLSAGALITGLDLLLHVLPMRYPAFQYLHSASASSHVLWIACGLVGMACAYLLFVRPVLGIPFAFVFAVLYAIAAPMIWRQFTFGCWAAMTTPLFACLGIWQAKRASNSVNGDPT